MKRMLMLLLHIEGNELGRVGTLIRSRSFFVLCCSAVVALSFWLTLVLLQHGGAAAWRKLETPLAPGTPQSSLAELPPLPDERLSWVGIAGINAQVVAGVPGVVTGLPVLRLIALEEGVHTVAARVTGLIKTDRYRITAWIRPLAGGNFGIAARDQADKDNGPNNGRAIFDLTSQNLLLVHGNAQAGIEHVGDWLTVWLELLTTDGQYVVNLYVCKGVADTYNGDGSLGVVLGGISTD
jgi:hypothetical protein